MIITAPPRPPEPTDINPDDLVEALIEEARQRARRRRLAYSVAASIVGVAVVAAIVAFNGAGGLRGEGGALDAGAEAPVPAAEDETATLVAVWGEVHEGWVLVYSDGRVLLFVDVAGAAPQGASTFSVVERYLTPAGLDHVRSGAVGPSRLFSGDSVPVGTWAEPEFTVYAFAEYAVCPHRDEWDVELATALRLLPAPVGELLRGTQQWYASMWPARPAETGPPEKTGLPFQCFALHPEQARTIVANADWYHNSRAVTLDGLTHNGGGVDVAYRAADGTLIGLHLGPVMPHNLLVASPG